MPTSGMAFGPNFSSLARASLLACSRETHVAKFGFLWLEAFPSGLLNLRSADWGLATPNGGISLISISAARTIYHQCVGQESALSGPWATTLCQTRPKSVRSKTPAPIGTIKKLHGILLTTTTMGSIPAGG